MTCKLAISPTVEFQVKLSVNDAGVKKEFSFRMYGKRRTPAELRTNLDENGDMKLMEFKEKVVRENLTDWRDQRLVLGEDDHPAPFSPEGLDCLLSLYGSGTVIHDCYMVVTFCTLRRSARTDRAR